MPKVALKVNGEPVQAEVEPRMLLSEFLRGPLGLTGTHVGCETGQCGACAVHVDGALVKSCSVLALEADGAQVTTIEGMAAPDGTLHPLQEAFRNYHGLQCGFCTPGMIMSAAALLDEVPQPTESQVREWLEGNLCRCTGYQNIVRAVMAASGQDVPALGV